MKPTYKKDACGTFTETNASIKSRISECTGFKKSEIVLLEAGYCCGTCTVVNFAVKKKGFWTDFEDWGRSEVYDL